MNPDHPDHYCQTPGASRGHPVIPREEVPWLDRHKVLFVTLIVLGILLLGGFIKSCSGAVHHVGPAATGDGTGSSSGNLMGWSVFVGGSHSGDTVHIYSMNATMGAATWPTGITYYASAIQQYGITWTFPAEMRVGQFCTGDFFSVGETTITGISPLSTNVGGRIKNGSMINPPGGSYNQGYNSAMAGGIYAGALNVALDVDAGDPLVVPTGSSLISSISYDTAGNRPQMDTMAILTVLASAPADGSFRPPYCGTDKTITHNVSELNYGVLASLTPVSGTLALSVYEPFVKRPWVDHMPLWEAGYLHPYNNMAHYGADMAGLLGDAILILQLNTYTNGQKAALMTGLCQIGIDFYGVLTNGGTANWIGMGGHACGRKWPILFTGLVLGDATMQAAGDKSGDYIYDSGHGPGDLPADYCHFGEDDQTFYVAQIDIDATASTPPWNHDYRDTCEVPYLAGDIGTAEWGIIHSEYPSQSNNCQGTEYRELVSYSEMATALGAMIMGAQTLWNHDPFFEYIDRYMTLTAPGGAWATSRRYGIGGVWDATMWDTYSAQYKTSTIPSAATSPSPANSGTGIYELTDLTWTTGTHGPLHHIYFGTTLDSVTKGTGGTDKGTQGTTTYDPGTLAYNTVYYWRIDETNEGGTTAGSVWSFTTRTQPVPPYALIVEVK